MNWINSWGEVEQIYDMYQDHRVRSVTKTSKWNMLSAWSQYILSVSLPAVERSLKCLRWYFVPCSVVYLFIVANLICMISLFVGNLMFHVCK